MLVQKENTIGATVAQNFRTAQVFERFGLDFCCGGKKSIYEACEKKGINPEYVLAELNNVSENGRIKVPDYQKWEPDFLIDYIINTHHFYLMKALPNILAHSQKVASVHGENHPEAISIADLFANLKEELEVHIQKEEKMLFPYIKNLLQIKKNNNKIDFPPFGSVNNPIKVMETEHENAGDALGWINKLSNNYTIPEDACTTFRVLYQELKEFEDDLHMHIHLENNILFPKAVDLEEELKIKN